MDMDVNCCRENKKARTIYPLVGNCPGTGMDDPAVADRDIRPASFRKLDVCKGKSGAAFHAVMIGTGS
jgi:hypothetical protein